MDLGTNWLAQFNGPLMSPDHHDLPSPPFSAPSSPFPLSSLCNFQQMSSPPLSPLWNFPVDNPLSSPNGPYQVPFMSPDHHYLPSPPLSPPLSPLGNFQLMSSPPFSPWWNFSIDNLLSSSNGPHRLHHCQSRQSAAAFSDRKGTGTGESSKITPRKRRKTITLAMIQQHFGHSLVDAARSLNGILHRLFLLAHSSAVSKSTLKRHCRKLGITTWPSKMMMSEGPVSISESVQDPPTDQFSPAVPCALTPRQDNLSSAMTTVKATYGDGMIKFQIDSTAERIIDQLKDGVAKRLQLQDGSYEMMYKDEDGDLILINCDEDAQECIRNSTLLPSKAVKLYLRDKNSSNSNRKSLNRKKDITCDSEQYVRTSKLNTE